MWLFTSPKLAEFPPDFAQSPLLAATSPVLLFVCCPIVSEIVIIPEVVSVGLGLRFTIKICRLMIVLVFPVSVSSVFWSLMLTSLVLVSLVPVSLVFVSLVLLSLVFAAVPLVPAVS